MPQQPLHIGSGMVYVLDLCVGDGAVLPYAFCQTAVVFGYVAQGIFEKAVLGGVVAQCAPIYTIEMRRLGAVLRQFVFDTGRHAGETVGTQVFLAAVQAVARVLENGATGLQKLALLALKDIPPYQVGCLALLRGRKAVEGAEQIIKREHTILRLDVIHDCPPMAVVVQLGTQYLEGESKPLVCAVFAVGDANLAFANIVAVVDKTRKDTLPAVVLEMLLIALESRHQLPVRNAAAELHPYGIIGVVEEQGMGVSVLQQVVFRSVGIRQTRRLQRF